MKMIKLNKWCLERKKKLKPSKQRNNIAKAKHFKRRFGL